MSSWTLFWGQKWPHIKKWVFYIMISVSGAKIVPNVVWYNVFFCLNRVCGWILLNKIHCSREERAWVCVCVCVCVSLFQFLSGLLGRLDAVCQVVLLLSPVLPTARLEEQQHTYTRANWNQPTHLHPQPLCSFISMLLNFRAESDNLEKCQNWL